VSAGCARCGSCCSPVVILADAYAASCERARAGEAVHDNDRFIASRLRPLGAFTDDDGETWLESRCTAYDPLGRACTAYEDRPPVCRDYPWYGRGPDPAAAAHMPRECSFLADLPPSDRGEDARPLIPLAVI
jgi:Fe-S-cluster containining protein